MSTKSLKKCCWILLATMAMFLFACGSSDSVSNSIENDAGFVEFSSDSWTPPVCLEGDILFSGGVNFFCLGGQWIVSNNGLVNNIPLSSSSQAVLYPISSMAIVPSSSALKVSSSSVVKLSSSSVKQKTSSSSAKVSSSSVLKQSFSYGELVDSRDNQKYKTISIGTQTWMAENLNFVTKEGKSFCYGNKAANCTKYGRMYQRAAAMDSLLTGCGASLSCDAKEPFQGVCPNGWHLPSNDEWKTLFQYVGSTDNAGKILKSTTGWASNGNGTDNYGFSILPGGFYIEKKFMNLESRSYFWTSSKTTLYSSSAEGAKADTSIYFALRCFLSSFDGSCLGTGSEQSDVGASIRCIKGAAKSEVVVNSSSSTGIKPSSSSSSLTNPRSSSSSLTISVGSMKDSRDGNTYSTVQIGDQIWMAENLRYKADSSFCYDNSSKSCTPDKQSGRLYRFAAAIGKSESECGVSVHDYGCDGGSAIFGASAILYTSNEKCSIGELPVQGVCPRGWHLPSEEEWGLLLKNIKNNYKGLAAAVDWVYDDGIRSPESTKGTNAFAFNAYPTGYRYFKASTVQGQCQVVPFYSGNNSYTSFWASSNTSGTGAPCVEIWTKLSDKALITGSVTECGRSEGHSVRCIKD